MPRALPRHHVGQTREARGAGSCVIRRVVKRRMQKTSLDKGKIKVLLLEGIHPSCVATLDADGYTHIELHKKSLPEDQLIEAISDAYIVGISSATHLTARVLEQAPRLIAIGCFCIGTNQVDLDFAQTRGIPVFNAPFSNTRSV